MLRYKVKFNGFPFSWKDVSKNSLWRCHYCLYSKLWRFGFFLLIVLSLFISSASPIFLSYMHGEMRTVSGCSHSNCQWHSFVCSVASYESHFTHMLSCWCSMHRVSTLFLDSPIYFPLHEQSNWYTPGWLFGRSFGLFFWQRMCCSYITKYHVKVEKMIVFSILLPRKTF